MFVKAAALSLVLLAGDPSIPTLVPAELLLIEQALQKLDAGLDDPSMKMRVESVLGNVRRLHALGIRDLAIVGMALSRASADPASCALLRRLEPSAACVK